MSLYNLLHGENPIGAALLACLNLTMEDVGRYRDAWLERGFVAGKTQTYLPWDSWQRPYVLEQPPV